MSASDLTGPAAGSPAAPGPAAYRQFPTAWRFALRNQARNRLAGLLLVAFVPSGAIFRIRTRGLTHQRGPRDT
jgi:ABC-2 type transport system permease protein